MERFVGDFEVRGVGREVFVEHGSFDDPNLC